MRLLGFYMGQGYTLDGIRTMQCSDFSRGNDFYFGFHQILYTMLMGTEFIAAMHKDNFVSNRFKH
ncbi:hypothetical protein D3C73_1502410 [compost metagenome]